MFIVETLTKTGTWFPFRYKLFSGDVATFKTESEARAAYVLWKGSVRPYGTTWRVTKVD
jgi:hypothetical protein